MSLAEAFSSGAGRFWRLFGVQLLVFALSLVALLLLLLPFLGFSILTFGLGVLCLLPLICLLIPVGLALEIYVLIAQVSIMVEDLRVAEALRRSWNSLRRNLGPAVVMGLILGLGKAVAQFVLALPAIAILLPLALALLTADEGFQVAGVATSAICLIVYLPFAIAATGMIQTFVTGSWTLTYQRMIERPGQT
jgi:hypothetical protein